MASPHPPRSLSLVALLLVACAGPQEAPKAPEGGFCKRDRDCKVGLVCKAAACSRFESDVGGACVTSDGCRADLTCLRGRCSEGPATAVLCAEACGNLTRLFAAEAAKEAKLPPDAPPEERAVIEAEVADFRAQCRAGCAKKTLEEARCLAGLRLLEGVSLCH